LKGNHHVKLNRVWLLAATAAAALTLAACGSSSNNSSGSTGASGSGGNSDCATGTLKAEGSTAQANAMTQWIDDYQKKCSGATINYNPTGSGAGVMQFNGGQVDFAGSDSALDPTKGETAAAQKRCNSPAWNLPMVVGPIAVAFHVKGIQDGGITLTPDLVAKIFLGQITTWDDPAIKSVNSGVNLPSEPIKVFFRSDESGTTQNFEKYLAASAPTVYTAEPSKTWSGKVGQGKAKSQGVQQAISSTEGGVGYIEWSYAVSGNLATAKINNGGGAVELNADTAAAGVAAAQVTGTGNDLTLKLDYATKAPGAYPIILVTYEIVCSKYSDSKVGAQVKGFLAYTASDGQGSLKQLGYAPLPSSIDGKVKTSVSAIS
jgi:phosphate transport system substrate-binding protein